MLNAQDVKSLYNHTFELSLFWTINGRISPRVQANLLSMKRNVVQVTQRVSRLCLWTKL